VILDTTQMTIDAAVNFETSALTYGIGVLGYIGVQVAIQVFKEVRTGANEWN
jgi:hypothetical protein